jgi:hypothetical protein
LVMPRSSSFWLFCTIRLPLHMYVPLYHLWRRCYTTTAHRILHRSTVSRETGILPK